MVLCMLAVLQCPQQSPASLWAGFVLAAMSDVLMSELAAGFIKMCSMVSLKSWGPLFITENNHERNSNMYLDMNAAGQRSSGVSSM